MTRLLDVGLEQLSSIIFKMGDLAEKTIGISIVGFLEGKRTEKQVRELSQILSVIAVEVEEKGFELISKYQPVASDLRIINSYLKIGYDLERFGRYAWDISVIEENFGGISQCDQWIRKEVEVISKSVCEIVKISIEALKEHNCELAKSIINIEVEVDKMYFDFLKNLSSKKNVTNKCTITSVLAVRYLERISDHAMYVGESVIYVTTGKKIIFRNFS